MTGPEGWTALRRDRPARPDWWATDPVLVVSHSAGRTGAPLLLLHLLRWIKANTSLNFEVLCLEDGSLVPAFEELAPTHVINHFEPRSETSVEGMIETLGGYRTADKLRHRRLMKQAESIRKDYRAIILNCAASAAVFRYLDHVPPYVVTWLHETETSFSRFVDPHDRKILLRETDWFFTCADVVSGTIVGGFEVDPEVIRRHYGFIEGVEPDPVAGLALRERLGIPPEAVVIGSSGTIQWRKGPDLFLAAARHAVETNPDLDLYFLWAGGPDPHGDVPPLVEDAEALGLGDRFRLVGSYDSVAQVFGAFDIFCLASREDPFPLVMLEASLLGVPVVSFDNGGVVELATAPGEEEPIVEVVEYLDVDALGDAMAALARDPARRDALAARARDHVLDHHGIDGGAERWYEDLRGLHEVFRVHSPRRPVAPSVILVDATDRQLGTMDKLEAHRAPGRLHRALSAFVVDREGRLLLQRRASMKYHFAERWSNTCCTHPEPGEEVVVAGERRLEEELGFTCDLVDVGTFTYTAEDASSGLVEREVDHVLVGRSDGPVDADPSEVSEVRWIGLDELRTEMAEHPDTFTPWFAEALDLAVGFLPFPQANAEVVPAAPVVEVAEPEVAVAEAVEVEAVEPDDLDLASSS